MKKEYFKPDMKVVRLHSRATLLQASIQSNGSFSLSNVQDDDEDLEAW